MREWPKWAAALADIEALALPLPSRRSPVAWPLGSIGNSSYVNDDLG